MDSKIGEGKMKILESLHQNLSGYNYWEDVFTLINDSLSPSVPPAAVNILAILYGKTVACGWPWICRRPLISELLYDCGYTITSVDFSNDLREAEFKEEFAEIRLRNQRDRPSMKWLVMNSPDLQIENEAFDVILDTGISNGLMHDFEDGHKYLSKVKRLLKPKGKYILCTPFAKIKLMGRILSRFHFGWKIDMFAVISGNNNMFMMFASKQDDNSLSEIAAFQHPKKTVYNDQARAFDIALKKDNLSRKAALDSFDPFIPHEDLKANFKELEPGRKLRLTIGQPGASSCFYNCTLIDAKQDSGPFSVPLLVLIIPSLRHLEWVTRCSKEQWRYIEYFNTARLLMVMEGQKNDYVLSEEDIRKDVIPFVNKLAPANCDDSKIQFVSASEGIKKTKSVHKVTSDTSGQILVEDLIYHQGSRHHHQIPYENARVRYLTIGDLERSKCFMMEGTTGPSNEGEKRKRMRKRTSEFKTDHNLLMSTHYNGIIFGLMLILALLQESSAQVKKLRTVIIGLGAGLLPMFLAKILQLHQLTVEVVEEDRVMLKVAKKYFDFEEAERLKVNIADGIRFVKKIAKGSSKIDILIVDVDSFETDMVSFTKDPRTSTDKAKEPRITVKSPSEEFIALSFLSTVKNALSEDGFLVINLVTRSVKEKNAVYGRLKQVFSSLFCLPIEDNNDVIFASNANFFPTTEQDLSEACVALTEFLMDQQEKWCQGVVEASKFFKPLIK